MRVILVDDEPLARLGLRNLLAQIENIELVAEAKNGFEAIDLFEKYNPDILFLDIQMPGLNGFEVIQQLKRVPIVVFVTAYDKYAMQAFEVLAIDYLLKPINIQDLKRVFSKIESFDKMINSLNPILHPKKYLNETSLISYIKRFAIKSGKNWLTIRQEEVDLFFSQDKYSYIRSNNINYAINDTLQNLENKIDPSLFIRVHRSAIIALNSVKSYHPIMSGRYLIIMKDGTKIKCSRSYSLNFRKQFQM